MPPGGRQQRWARYSRRKVTLPPATSPHPPPLIRLQNTQVSLGPRTAFHQLCDLSKFAFFGDQELQLLYNGDNSVYAPGR